MASRLTPQTIGYGALAGAATAMLCLGLASGSLLAVFLFFLSPVPLMVAGLGYGLSAALVGAAVAVVASAAFSNVTVAVLVALAIAAPACASAHWLKLGRPAEEIGGPAGQIAWYPLANVLFAVALLTGFAYLVLGAMIGFGPDVANELARELVARFQETDPDLQFTAEGEASLRNFLQTAIPIVQPFFWMLTLTASIYIALAVARRSGLMLRPKDDWPVGLRMPRAATLAFTAALLVSFVPGGVGTAASVFAGALAAGFTLAGFAALHARTRGMASRGPILAVAYLSVVFVAFTTFLFFVAGLLLAGRHIPLSPAPGAGKPPANSNANPNE